MPALFDPYSIKDVRLRNRIAVSPMCQYSAVDGVVGDWHLVNLGSRAVGGAGLVIAEATAVSPEGRITQGCAGLWNDEQAQAWSRVARFVESQGAVPGIQLAHAGRKASANRPWEGDDHLAPDSPSAWQPVGPSALAFGGNLPVTPRELSTDDIHQLCVQFAQAAQRALDAGFRWLELHFAHGYLVNSFLSPIANHRNDAYGGSLENRSRLAEQVLDAVRKVWPQRYPLAVRIGIQDYEDAGLPLEEGIEVVRRLKARGLDMVDVSIGVNSPDVSNVPWGPSFMVPSAKRVRDAVQLPVGVGWMIESAKEADTVIREASADIIFLARPELRDPYWPYHAAAELQHKQCEQILPIQYSAWLARGEKIAAERD